MHAFTFWDIRNNVRDLLAAGELIHLMILAIIAAAVMSMLIAFGVVNPRSQFVYTIADFLNRVTDPFSAPSAATCPISAMSISRR